EIVVRAAMKPLPTLMRPLRSVDLNSGEAAEELIERSDVSAVEALAVVAEAAVAWELARAAREKFGGDALGDFVGSWRAYLARLEPTVIAVGGGAVETPGLFRHELATVVHLPVDVETAWERVRRSPRPLARNESEFRRRFELRAPLYAEVADATATDVDDLVL